MVERITAKKCREYLETLGRIGGFPTKPDWVKTKHGHKPQKSYFHIEVAYGRPRLELILHKSGGSMNISPRLPAGQMMLYLQAAGVAGLKARYKEMKDT